MYKEWVSEPYEFLPANFDKNGMFFNSGVLLVNLAMWRKENVVQRLEKLARKIPGFDDQFLLNIMFYRNFGELDGMWNLVGLGDPSSSWEGLSRPSLGEIEAAQILHFTGICKFALCKPPPDPKISMDRCTSDYAHVYQKYCTHDTCEADSLRF
jgi:hypothetical protein